MRSAQLIGRGADVNAKETSQEQTALMWAAAERHADVVRLLIENGANCRRARSEDSVRCISPHVKAMSRARDCCWLRARTSISDRNRLWLRNRAGEVRRPARIEWSRQLYGRRRASGGPSYEATVSAGSTPLLVATMRAQVPFALFLLEHGADPNASDAGMTPLHWAVGTWESGEANPVFGFTDAMSGIPERQAKLQLVKALLARGANPNVPMTQRPPGFAGGHTDVSARRRFSSPARR